MRARFWVWINNGHVKLALSPGQSLTWFRGGPTDEGYSSEWSSWTHEDGRVRCEWATDGRDCDGRFQDGGESACELYALKSQHCPPFTHPEGMPRWLAVDRWQRDHSAEAAGY